MRDLRHTQAGTIGDAERRPVLDARCHLEQLCHLLDAQYVGQLPGTMRQHQAPREVGSLKGHIEQKAQRRYRAVDDGLPDAVLALVNLKAPHILRRRGVGRSSQEAREGANMADIVVLGTRSH